MQVFKRRQVFFSIVVRTATVGCIACTGVIVVCWLPRKTSRVLSVIRPACRSWGYIHPVTVRGVRLGHFRFCLMDHDRSITLFFIWNRMLLKISVWPRDLYSFQQWSVVYVRSHFQFHGVTFYSKIMKSI